MRRRQESTGLAAGLMAAAFMAALPGAGAAADAPAERLIVRLRAEALERHAGEPGRVSDLAERRGLRVRTERALGRRLRVIELEQPATADAGLALARLAADPQVEYVERDARAYRHAAAVDPLFTSQWYLHAAEPAALDVATAWDEGTGSAGTVVAVLDTGVRFDHPDLGQAGRGGRLLPGYDFVSGDSDGRFRLANDGDGWDRNPADPGDWLTEAEAALPLFADCDPDDSSWHGTRVAGLIGAIANNNVGMAGATWNGWILPVRVLGKCYGRNSDILQGMRWAAGLGVSGVPVNPYPARIINMSLGADGSCTRSYQDIMDELAAAGVLVVASAGNAGGPVEYPANCAGMVAVAGLRHAGTKVGYSSLGREVAIAAPGGNCVNDIGPCLFSVDSTTNLGAQAPGASSYTDPLAPNIGTSFSAPFVSGIAALMHAANGNLRGRQLISRMQEGARAFPAPGQGVPVCHVPLNENDVQGSECGCTTTTCGAGMAYAPGAVAAARRPIAAVVLPASVAPGQVLTFDGAGSAAACGRNVAGFQWSAFGASPAIGGASTPTATVAAPLTGTFTLRLTVTDDHGAVDTADIVLTPTSAGSVAPATAGTTACPLVITPADPGPFVDDGPPGSNPPPAGGGGGGGGGGASGVAELLLLAVAGAVRRRLRHESVALRLSHRHAVNCG
ncbi:MAG: S8 family serine peptidase [Gammaproteobacteria bacterium]|nr:S8 family serine peptidase [Gammaproteobacteria bacterium]